MHARNARDRGRSRESVGDCERLRENARRTCAPARRSAPWQPRGLMGVGEMARGRVGECVWGSACGGELVGESVWGKALGASSHLPWGETNGRDRSVH